jgi:hypothetical protein
MGHNATSPIFLRRGPKPIRWICCVLANTKEANSPVLLRSLFVLFADMRELVESWTQVAILLAGGALIPAGNDFKNTAETRIIEKKCDKK